MYRPGFFVEQVNRQRTRYDAVLALVVVFLAASGLGVLWSASWFRAEQLYGEPLRFVMRQSMWLALGVVLMFIASLVPLDRVRSLIPVVLVFTLVLSILPFVPGVSARYMGARRWIIIFNVSFQPSELVKVVLVFYLAHMLGRRKGDFSHPLQTLMPPVLVVLLFTIVVLLQNDYSTAMFLLLVSVAVFYVAAVPHRYFVRSFGLLVPIAGILLFTREHRVRRLMAFLNPNFDPAGSGFQILAARRALESGGPWGMGIGRGVRKIGGLPEAQSDFIFAVLGEELGFAGIAVITVFFLLFAWRGLVLARQQEDWFRSLVIFGCTISIVLQAMLNIAVVAGMVPATGIPLPFFSSGGSSLMMTLVMTGLIFNASAPDGETVRHTSGVFSPGGIRV